MNVLDGVSGHSDPLAEIRLRGHSRVRRRRARHGRRLSRPEEAKAPAYRSHFDRQAYTNAAIAAHVDALIGIDNREPTKEQEPIRLRIYS
jgi:hypothetical protein